ncbi:MULTISPECIES: L,D-transpeptidase [Candidatus Williamhamiltonella]|nr:L,D-transpeptidase [Candidatus Hamiltonella defensa]
MSIKNLLQSMLLCWSLYSFSVILMLTPQSSSADHPFKGIDSIDERERALLSQLPEQIKLYSLSTLSELYEKNAREPLWQDPLAIQDFEQQLLEVALLKINPQFSTWLEYLSDPNITGIARDIILSDAMLGYLYFISSLTSEEKVWLYRPPLNSDRQGYQIMRAPENKITSWQEAIHKNETYHYVNSLAPQHPQYRKMQTELLKLLSDNSPWPKLTERVYLREGYSSKDISNVKKILYRLGIGNMSLTDVDSQVYSHDLVMAIKQFQKNRGLPADGIIGIRTRNWLNVSPKILARLLALNMQRLRFTPADIQTGILVNIPDYSLNYYEEGKIRLFSKVIVGRPDRKTPVMQSAINQIVINPDWNVPHSLAREDILPQVIKNIDYLQEHNYRILSSWSQNAEVIDPESIDWENISIENFPYYLRQTLGPNNPLGHYKFNMPNRYSIFLHDTPNKAMFQRYRRAGSSGCVRVQKASELARLLLKKTGLTDADILNFLKENKSTYRNTRKRIPVWLYYLTAWVSEDGATQFRTDIYHYDQSVL